MTADSATAGCSLTARSTSNEEMFSPRLSDGVLDPVDEEVIPFGVAGEAVARMEPSVAPRRRRLLGHLEVPTGDDPRIGRAHHHLAEPVGPDVLVGVVDQFHLEAGRTTPDAPHGGVIGQLPTAPEGIADLGHAEPGADPEIEPLLELLELGDDRGHHHAPQGVVGVGRAGREPEDHGRHRPDETTEDAVVPADVVPVGRQAERLSEHEPGVVHEGHAYRRLPRDVVRRVHAVVPVIGRGDDVLGQHAVEILQAGPRHQHTFGRTGRPRRVDDRGDVAIGRRVDVFERRSTGEESLRTDHFEGQLRGDRRRRRARPRARGWARGAATSTSRSKNCASMTRRRASEFSMR